MCDLYKKLRIKKVKPHDAILLSQLGNNSESIEKQFKIITKDREGNFWGVNTFNRIFKLKKDLTIEKQIIIKDKINVYKLFFDKHNRCWIGTWGNGLYLFDINTSTTKQHNIGLNTDVVHEMSTWQYKDRNFIMVTSYGYNNFSLIDEETLAFKTYGNQISKQFFDGKVSQVISAFSDRDNNLLLSTDKGLIMATPKSPLFEIIPIMKTNNNGKTIGDGAGVYNYYEAKENYWLCKRYNGGTFVYNKNWELQKHIPQLVSSLQNKFHSSTNNGSESYDYKEVGNAMYATTEEGLVKINTINYSTSIYYTPNDTLPPRLRNIVPINEKTWWIRAQRLGIFVFDVTSHTFLKLYRLKNKETIRNEINYLYKTKVNEMYATSIDGLYKFNPAFDNFEKVAITGVDDLIMNGIAEDNNGVLWLATLNGVVGYNTKENSAIKLYEQYSEMGSVGRIAVDSENNVWFNCQQGYWCWQQTKKQMIKFGYNLNLPDNRSENNTKVFTDGLVYAGATDAIVKFTPTLLNTTTTQHYTVITDILNNSKNVFPTTSNDSVQNITIPAGTNSINIFFSVTDYSFSNNYDLFYKITPGNGEYIKTNDGLIGFNNLPHNSYTIEVIGKNKITGNYSKATFLNLIVQPHWYQRLLVKIIAALGLGFLIYYFVKRRIQTIRREEALKQQITETEIAALKAQMNPHFMFNCINSIDSFIQTNDKYNATIYLNKFAKLIRNVLDSSKQNVVRFSKDIETLKLYLDLETIRHENKFAIKLNIDPHLLESDFNIPPLIIQPFVENAILHGLKNKTTNDGLLQINIEQQNNALQYIIEDNGIGRAAAEKIKQTKESSYGMQLSMDRIKLFNNEKEAAVIIKDLYSNNISTGTKVTVQLNIN